MRKEGIYQKRGEERTAFGRHAPSLYVATAAACASTTNFRSNRPRTLCLFIVIHSKRSIRTASATESVAFDLADAPLLIISGGGGGGGPGGGVASACSDESMRRSLRGADGFFVVICSNVTISCGRESSAFLSLNDVVRSSLGAMSASAGRRGANRAIFVGGAGAAPPFAAFAAAAPPGGGDGVAEELSLIIRLVFFTAAAPVVVVVVVVTNNNSGLAAALVFDFGIFVVFLALFLRNASGAEEVRLCSTLVASLALEECVTIPFDFSNDFISAFIFCEPLNFFVFFFFFFIVVVFVFVDVVVTFVTFTISFFAVDVVDAGDVGASSPVDDANNTATAVGAFFGFRGGAGAFFVFFFLFFSAPVVVVSSLSD